MSTQGKIRTLFSDLENTEALFPTTKVKAISDDNGVGLDALLSTTVHTGPVAESAAVAPVNADTLGGRKASEYATENFVAAKIAEAKLEGEDVDLSGYATKDYAYDTASEAALTALANAKAYTDGNISTWVGDSTVASQISSAVATRAPAGHEHNANNITSGTLSVDRLPVVSLSKGGTGATNSADARAKLGITPANIGAAPASHTHSASDVGALPISGGTMTGLLRLGGSAMQNFDSPSVVATYINNNSSEGLGYANTGSLSVGYASSAGNADTLDGKHASDFIPGATAAWLPKHGMTFAELPYGFFAYSVNPGCALSVGFPSGFSEYGTIFGINSTEYTVLNYLDVFGNLATYDTHEGYWKSKLSSSGDTMYGTLNMNSNRITSVPWPSDTYDATNKSYVDTRANEKLSLSGGTMSGDINMGAHNIYGVNALFGTSGTFGTSLPAAGNAGRIFFKKVSG